MAELFFSESRDDGVRRGEGTSARSGHHWLLLAANISSLMAGSLSSSLLSRFYFVHGGSSRWVSTWVQCAGFPILLLPLVYCSVITRRRPFSGITRRLLFLCLLIGVLLGVNNFLISWGISYLPVSTSSLLLSSQLAFTLVLSALLAGQKVTFTNLNCVVLLTLSSVLLALGAGSDRPVGVSTTQFFLGFLSILGAAALFALYLPVMEVVYRRVHGFWAVVEMQVVMEAAATAFATARMAGSGGFGEMGFELGRGAYLGTVCATVVAWQMVFMGTAGMVFLTSSLNSGIWSTAMLSVNVVGGVVVFGDRFGGQKAAATVMCIWGFASYLYGEYKRKKEMETEEEEGMEMERVESGDGREPVR